MTINERNKPRILVTGATGKTGGAVTHQLLEKGYPVTALARRHDARSQALADAGATIAIGDLIEPESLRSAMQDVQRAYFVAPWSPTQLHGAMNFAVSAADARLEVVVAITQWLAHPSNPSVATRRSYLTDRIFEWMPGVDTVTVNTGFFADNYMVVLDTIAQLGIFPFRLGESKVAPVSNEDIARVAVGALTQPERHVGKLYRPTGPELLDPNQLAAVFEKVLERPVQYQELSERMFLKAVRSQGMDPFMMSQLRHYLEDYRRGSFTAGGVNDVVREVGGSEPESFETITRRYVAANPMTRQSFTNKLRAMAAFAKILFTPAPDLSAYEREQRHPLLRAPEYSIDNAAWRDTHATPNAFGATRRPQRRPHPRRLGRRPGAGLRAGSPDGLKAS